MAEQEAQLRDQVELLRTENQQIVNVIQQLQAQVQAANPGGRPNANPTGLRLPKPKAPEEFNPAKKSDVDAWLFSCESYFAMYDNITEANKVRTAATYFRGLAGTWWQHYMINSTIMISEEPWTEFKTAVKARWQPINPVRAARDKIVRL